MSRDLMTTGQAAKFCSVTRDTVCKWIRAGRLTAQRTAGGHARIAKEDLETLLRDKCTRTETHPTGEEHFYYCWEFYGEKELSPECSDCLVYQTRTQRCYEIARRFPESGVRLTHCDTDCSDCDYFKLVHGSDVNILVLTESEEQLRMLRSGAPAAPFNLEIATCEYDCSRLLNSFRPDYIVVDCCSGRKPVESILGHLSKDPRISFSKIVLAGELSGLSEVCKSQVFAWLKRPFGVEQLEGFLESMWTRETGQEALA